MDSNATLDQIASALKAHPTAKVELESYNPVASNDSPEGRELNRRTEVIVVSR